MTEAKTTEAMHMPIGFQMDARAVVSPRAHLGEGVTVGAYAIVGDDVELGAGCKVQPHAVIQGPARIGRDNNFYPFCSVGCDPQDLKFAGERTELVIGDENQFREYVTVSRGTGKGGVVTRVGSHAYIGGFTVVTQDVAPFSIVVCGRETSCFGINRIGLSRRGYTPQRIE